MHIRESGAMPAALEHYQRMSFTKLLNLNQERQVLILFRKSQLAKAI